MHIRWGDQEVQRQAGIITEEHMYPIALQERVVMVGKNATESDIRIDSSPGKHGNAIDDQFVSTRRDSNKNTPTTCQRLHSWEAWKCAAIHLILASSHRSRLERASS